MDDANRHIRISLRRRGWGICCLVLILAGVSIANQRQQVKALIWYFIAGRAPLPLTLIRDGVEMTLAITPTPPISPVLFATPPPTVTPVWLPNDYF
ncbi:MAG: hypothetical protein R2867_05135 [Caldilineaceae bacterium]